MLNLLFSYKTFQEVEILLKGYAYPNFFNMLQIALQNSLCFQPATPLQQCLQFNLYQSNF